MSTYPAITGTGYSIPAGSLDRWFNARALSATQLVPVVENGDSTMAGQTLTGPNYSPIKRLRDRLNSAGYTDGGHGNLDGTLDDLSPGEGVVIGQGFAQQNAFVMPGESFYSDATGDNETFTRIGRYLTILYNRFNSAGRFTYEIDSSGIEIPIDPAFPNAGNVYTFARIPRIDLGSDGTHTVVIRNKGGRLLTPPAYSASTANGSGTGGSLAAGSYDYAAAFVSPAGKIAPLGATVTVAIAAGQTYSFYLLAQPDSAGTTTNYYRRVSGVGSFTLIGSVTTNIGSPYLFTDTGAAGTTVYAADTPPVLNSTNSFVNVVTIATKAVGIVLHNFAVRGSTSGMDVVPYNQSIFLGLDFEASANVAAVNRAIDTAPGAIRPVLLILSHGINNQQQTPTDQSAQLAADTVAAIRAARYAGVDALVTIPAFEAAGNQVNAPAYRAALKAAAEGEGAGWVDIGMGGALPGLVAGITTNPHLTQSQYQTQADFLWDNVLGATPTALPGPAWTPVIAERWNGSAWVPVVAEEWNGTAWAPSVLERST